MSDLSSTEYVINPMDENLDKIPKILYKYRSFDANGYSLQLALNGEVYFASAKEFNDPFDNYFLTKCKLYELEGEKFHEELRRKLFQYRPDADEKTVNGWIKGGKKLHHLRRKGDPRALKPGLENQYNSWGVVSLTANPKSLPMWAYYADCHKGLCIGLRSSEIALHQMQLCQHNKMLYLYKVHYSNKIPEVCIDASPNDVSESTKNQIRAILYTKSYQWKHEDEYRLVFYKPESRKYVFGRDSVAEIILGEKVSKDDKNTLIKHLRKSNSKAVLKQAIHSQTMYDIEFKEISL